MAEEKHAATLELHYKDAPGCQTIIATGVVLAGPAGDSGLLQIALYTDVMTPDAETLVLQSQQGPAATYTRSGTTSATPHREIQARVLMAPATLRSLQAAINVQLARVDQGGVTV